MWPDGEVPENSTDDLSERRLFVVFANSATDPKRAFGPFRTVQVTADSVWVFDDNTPLRIARKTAGGSWQTQEGSAPPAMFRDVLVLCPPSGTTAEQLEERLGPRKEE